MAKPEPETSFDDRRPLTLIASLILMGGSALCYFYGTGNNAAAAGAVLGRVGAVLFALFIAWPSLRRPAAWLPAGAAIICVVALIAIAAQPKLVIYAIPATGLLIFLSGMVRVTRGKKD